MTLGRHLRWGLLLAALFVASCGGADAHLEESLATALEGSLAGGSLFVGLGVAALGGLLTALTPCVYPLIPITVRYFGGINRDGVSSRRVVLLAAVYVLGMMLLYAALGTLFASFGGVFGSFLGNGWVTGALAVFCAAMGASMLGAFTIQLPPALATRLSRVGGESVGGALLMGGVSGLIAAPCTGPILGVILAVIASTGDAAGGFGLMLAFGLGLGLPFLVLAIFANSLTRLPRGGRWMEEVKVVMAAAMFVVAVYFARLASIGLDDALSNVEAALPLGIFLLLVGIAAAVLLLRPASARAERLARWSGAVLIAAGVALLIFSAPDASVIPGGTPISWLTSHDGGLARARAEGRPVMIDFSAEWCLGCKDLEDKTFADARVRTEARRFVAIKLAQEEHADVIDELWEHYGVRGLPTVLFIDSQGRVLRRPRVTGFVHAERFAELMARVH